MRETHWRVSRCASVIVTQYIGATVLGKLAPAGLTHDEATAPGGPPLVGGPRVDLARHRGGILQRLVDHAIALGQLEERRPLLVGQVGVEVEPQADLPEADRHLLAD